MWNFVLLSTLAIAAAPVQVETLDGQKLSGEVQMWTDAALVVSTNGGAEQSIPAAKLTLVRPLESTPPEFAAGSIFLELVDGSTLEAVTYTVAQGVATVELRGGQAVKLPMKIVAAVRLQPHGSPELEKQWDQIRQTKPTGDLVVVRKGETALDFLEGVLGDVTADNVAFKLDGDNLSVKRTKLTGMIYFKNEAPVLPELAATLTTHSGLKLQAKKVAWQSEAAPQLIVTTLAGAEITLPWNEIAQLDFSAGRMTYLSNLVPESLSYTPFIPLPENQPQLAKFGQAVFDRAFEGGPLRFIPEPGSQAAPAEYARGIALRSHSELVYRLPDKFRRLRALAFIDARMRGAGHVKLTIFGDEKPLLETDVAGRVAPVQIDLDITDVRRIKIVVDYGANADIADHLDLADARVTK